MPITYVHQEASKREGPAVITHRYDATAKEPSLKWRRVEPSYRKNKMRVFHLPYYYDGTYTHNHPSPADENGYKRLCRDTGVESGLTPKKESCVLFMNQSAFSDGISIKQKEALQDAARMTHGVKRKRPLC